MAISNLGAPAASGASAGSNQTSIAASSAATIPANSLVVVVVQQRASAALTDGVPTVKDEGNVTFERSSGAGADVINQTAETRTTIFSNYYASATSHTYTASWTTALNINSTRISVFVVSGAASSSWLDITGTQSGGGGGASTTSTSPSTVAQADSLSVWAATYFNAGATGSAPTNYTDRVNIRDATRGAVFHVADHTPLTASATEDAAYTPAGTTDHTTVIAVYKGVGGGGSAPANTVAPAVTGTRTQGQTLSTNDGTWSNTPTSFTYQWQSDTAGNNTFTNIASATSNTYVLTASEVGDNVRCVVTAINASGSTPANSNALGLIGPLYTVTSSGGFEVCGNAITSHSVLDPYPAMVVSDNPDGYWRLTDSASPFLDYSGGGHDLTGSGTLTPNSAALVPGDTAAGVEFGGGSAGAATFSIPLEQPLVVEAWVRLDSTTTAARRFVSNGHVSGGGWAAGVSSTASGGFWRFTTFGVKDYTFSTAPTPGTTHHVVFVFNADNSVDLYLDGTLSQSITGTAGALTSTDTIHVGANGNGTETWDGVIQDAAVYTSLSSTRIAAHAAGIGAGPAPANTVAPAVTGTTQTGSALSTTNGTWSNTPTGFSYQWQRDVAENGVFSNIGSATSSSYTLVSADLGNDVRCVVTATNAGGSTSANSNAVGPITSPPAAPVNTGTPSAGGITAVGFGVSTSNGTWNNSPTSFTYQWQSDVAGNGVFSNISAATSANYTCVSGDVGNKLRCVVTATNATGSASANSNAIGPVTLNPPASGHLVQALNLKLGL